MNPLKKIIFEYCIPFVGRIFRRKNQYVNVIYYHDVVKEEGSSFMKINFNFFKQQMEYIASKEYSTYRFDDLTSDLILEYNPKKVIITFDDGWLSNYTEIYDLMSHLGLKYNVFLTIGKIGNDPNYLSWEQIRKMHESGLVGFGIHTYSHPDMSNISKINPELEFEKANKIFEQELNYKPNDFCYPFGFYSEESNEYISTNLDYKRIYTSKLMYSYFQNDKIIFGRNGISNDEPFNVFKAKLKGYFNIWRKLFG